MSTKLATPAIKSRRKVSSTVRSYAPWTKLEFSSINQRAQYFANHIESHIEKIIDVLLEYESFEVAQDEIARTLDLFRNLDENSEYFELRIGAVTSFLPKNQPLYALSCFVIVPSLMASEVHYRIPQGMRYFFPRLLRILKTDEFFPNIIASRKERLKFLEARSALHINPKNQESIPVTDVVIFTGTSNHAERLRLVFDQRTLFIANGSGHNPVVVSENADISKAVEAVLDVQLYNQGQDCAAPNAILVHRHSMQPFMRILREKLRKVRVGNYGDRTCRVGPISEPEDLERIQALFVQNRSWFDSTTRGIIRTGESIVEPTIICKPLKFGGNFNEVFAPIFFIQQYKEDGELSEYFDNPHYARNAMYISLFGTSNYINQIIGRQFGGKVLHDRKSVLRDTHLHAQGVERGTLPYGGFGYAASSYSIHGKITCCPTLPQRDIYEQIVKPLLLANNLERKKDIKRGMTKVLKKDVRKLLGMKIVEQTEGKIINSTGKRYIDSHDITSKDRRYIELASDKICTLLDHPNVEHIATMVPKHVEHVRALFKKLKGGHKFESDELRQFLYSIPKNPNCSDEENKLEQLAFFKHIYQLLFKKDAGPRLGQFLLDANRDHILNLLNI